MGIVHSALRRDFTRASDVLNGPPLPGDAQRVAIAQHLQAMMDFLHVHHSGEDAWLWPTMRRLNPSASELLDQMEDDHLAIVPHMEKVWDRNEIRLSLFRHEGVVLLLVALSDIDEGWVGCNVFGGQVPR